MNQTEIFEFLKARQAIANRLSLIIRAAAGKNLIPKRKYTNIEYDDILDASEFPYIPDFYDFEDMEYEDIVEEKITLALEYYVGGGEHITCFFEIPVKLLDESYDFSQWIDDKIEERKKKEEKEAEIRKKELEEKKQKRKEEKEKARQKMIKDLVGKDSDTLLELLREQKKI